MFSTEGSKPKSKYTKIMISSNINKRHKFSAAGANAKPPTTHTHAGLLCTGNMKHVLICKKERANLKDLK